MEQENNENSFIQIKCVTWVKDSHGLFDYETRNILMDILIIEESQFQENNEDLNLTKIIKQQNEYFIEPISFPDQHIEKQSYLIVRSLKNENGEQKGYKLQLNDIIKIGRIEYQVVQININNHNQQVDNLYSQDWQIKLQQLEQNEQNQCRICMEETQTEDNPIVSPCNCKGFSKCIHFNCLKQWLDSSIKKVEQDNTIHIKYKKWACEICQCSLPKYFFIKNKRFDLINIEFPTKNFIILENIQRDQNISKGILIIYQDPNNDTIKMGRGHQCVVRINDISVSRFHTYIKFIDNHFVIFDNNSKFGTLIQLKNQLQITKDKVAIQIGRTVITFAKKDQ